MKRKVISALVGCCIGVLPLPAIKLPLRSWSEDVVGFGVMMLSMPGFWVGILVTGRVDANFWVAVPVNAVLYGGLTYLVLKVIAKRRGHANSAIANH